MPGRLVLWAIMIDIGLVVFRVLTDVSTLAVPGAISTLVWLGISFVAAAIVVICSNSSKSIVVDLRFATAAGLLGGIILMTHMALENFGARVGEDWRLTLAVMLATFAIWLSSGWRTARRHSALVAGTVAGCWTAIISVILVITFGFVGMYFDIPSRGYVQTWPEYLRSGSSDPQGFAIVSTLDAGSGHLITALLLGPILGCVGWFIGSLQTGNEKPTP